MRNEKLDLHLNSLELGAWKSFKQMMHNFLLGKKTENHADAVQDMLIAYQKLGCCMSLKIHFLHSHFDFFSENLGNVSDEHGERCPQDISKIKTHYQGKPGDRMMGDYGWYLHRKTDDPYRRKARVQKAFLNTCLMVHACLNNELIVLHCLEG